MSLLLSGEILTSLKHELSEAKESVQIITAFCKTNTIQYLDNCVDTSVPEKRIMVRFRLDDILKGATDFSVLDYCLEKGWKAFLRFDLHAKTYIVDNKRGIIGSANATNSGLNLGIAGNTELATLFDMEPDDLKKIEALYRDAIPVDVSLLDLLRKQYSAVGSTSTGQTAKGWSKDITDLFKPKVDTLFSHELPDKETYAKGQYIDFLDEVVVNDQSFKNAFRWSNSYLWLLNTLENNGGCLYFGELSSKLHDSLVSDPKPYRKDVKKMLANMLALITTLNMEEVTIDRPNYSQRIQLRESSY